VQRISILKKTAARVGGPSEAAPQEEKLMKKTIRLAGILGLAVACSTVAWAGSEKLSAELRPENRTGNRASAQNTEVIVQYKRLRRKRITSGLWGWAED
jgi:hypothetical protein